VAAILPWASPAGAQGVSPQPSVLVVFIPADEPELASLPGASLGMMSASQGPYSITQLALDIGQGARISSDSYSHSNPPPLTLRQLGGSGIIEGWRAARLRAESAPQVLTPGLLASEIPGGAAYAGIAGAGAPDAPVAADTTGHVAALSLGSTATLPERVGHLMNSSRLIVADLHSGGEGYKELLALAVQRRPGELLLVLQRTSNVNRGPLLWVAAAGLSGGGGRELTSQSTQERGLVVSVDLAPTILAHLGQEKLPDEIRGKPIETGGTLHSASLRSLMARLRVIAARRLPALAWLLGACALLLIACNPWPRARGRAIRTCSLGILWAPIATLITGALEPSPAVEYLLIALVCLGLGALTDLLLPWPRALLAPAIAAVLALTGDALGHTQLLMRSLLGPDPILGSRFYGIGNELKSGLAVLVLAAIAAALYPSVCGRRSAAWMAGAGVLLAIVEGSAKIGAGVGGVILVSGAFAVAVAMLLPGALNRRRALILLVTPLLGLVLLALLDLLTAHGAGHFTGSVLDASSPGELRDIIVRRYSTAWSELRNHAMPVATVIALGCAVAGVRMRRRLLAPVDGDPVWLAAFGGGLAAGVLGSLVEDSGPVLLVVALFALGCVASYLWSPPSLSPSTPDRPHESRSHARRPPAARAR
jgi:hypothetical protein